MTSIPHVPGIYIIRCEPTGKVYVGSSKDIAKRWGYHCRDLRSNRHNNPYLQHAWNKYGHALFICEVIEIVEDQSNLVHREQYWINTHKATDNKYGYNASVAMRNPESRPRDETIAKIRAARMKQVFTPEMRQKAALRLRGKPKTKEHNASVSRALIGHSVSEETRRKMSEARKGKPNFKGRKPRPDFKVSPEGRAAQILSNARSYRIVSPSNQEYIVFNLANFCSEHGLRPHGMRRVACGDIPHYKGWICKRI